MYPFSNHIGKSASAATYPSGINGGGTMYDPVFWGMVPEFVKFCGVYFASKSVWHGIVALRNSEASLIVGESFIWIY